MFPRYDKKTRKGDEYMERKSISEVLKGCIDKDDEAMSILYRESILKIRTQMRKTGLQHADIEDIIQETMMRVYAKLDQIKNPECYSRWLFQVTKSVYLAHVKMKNRYICDEMSEKIEENRSYMLPSGCMDTIENNRVIQLHMADLKKPWQEVMKLKYLEELSEEEISKKMKIPKGTVKSRLHYAKISLHTRG